MTGGGPVRWFKGTVNSELIKLPRLDKEVLVLLFCQFCGQDFWVVWFVVFPVCEILRPVLTAYGVENRFQGFAVS